MRKRRVVGKDANEVGEGGGLEDGAEEGVKKSHDARERNDF